MATLRTVKCGETVTVTKILGEGALRRRIMDMGITKGDLCICAEGSPSGRSGGDHRPGLRTVDSQRDAENILVE